MIHRFALAVLVLASLSGCAASSQMSVSESDTAGFATVTETFAGCPARIYLETESDHGQLVEALPDSTRWIRRDGSLRTVSTSELRGIVCGERTAKTKVGIGVGLAMSSYVLVEGVPGVGVRGMGDAQTPPQVVTSIGFTAVSAFVLGTVGEWIGQSMERRRTVWIVP